MSMSAAALFEMLQRVGSPLVRAIEASAGGGSLLSMDRRGSFLDIVLHCCAAGAADLVNVLQLKADRDAPRISATDGFQLFATRSELSGVTRSRRPETTSLDRIGMLLGKVIAIALDADGVRERAWRGAEALIRRDRPIFIAYAQNDKAALAELANHGYVIKSFAYWGYPKFSTLVVMALPQEKVDMLALGDAPLIAPPPALLSPGAPSASAGRAVPQTLFDAREFEVESGFHAVETDGCDSWVWSGPSRESRIALPCQWLGMVKLTVSIVNMTAGRDRRETRFRVNDKDVAARWTDRGAEISAFVEPEDFGGAMTLSVIVPHVSRPHDMEVRRLGCCINQLEVNWP